ncbi:MBL fold metallo-hydrolase [Frankia gtarii]|uniref:MBL fold metallo-hydrolase n=1 Tax=Frankia gtarii TaxID=2950102 RepID=UPI0021BF7D32|nr:MBL fold metallo-hydrolase [Frankia gtarii]
MDSPMFLRSNVIVEPLVDRFYAWLHTLAPVQAAMNLANLQIPLLESYLEAPPIHLAASRNPALRGGYFVNIEADRAGEVRDLTEKIKRERVRMVRFAEAVSQAQDLLREEADGYDLTPLYAKLPAELRGVTELFYDTDNRAALRFIEPLIYGGNSHLQSRQSVQLSLDPSEERPFILSTPRLPSPDVLELEIPFHHPGLETLFKARVHPTAPSVLRELLELDDSQAKQLVTLLNDRPNLASDRHIKSGGRIRYFGHACLVVQTPDSAIVTDPFISADGSRGDRYTFDDLPDYIDLVLISHGHQDHLVLETLFQLKGRVGAIVVPRSSRGGIADPSIGLMLKSIGFPVVEVDDFDEIPISGGTVTATPFLGEHCDLDIRGKSTYRVDLGARSVFVGADSSGVDRMVYRYIRQHLGAVDYAFLGMECDGAPLTWLYQALLTRPMAREKSDSRKLSGSNAEQAASIASELGAKESYVYAMGEEPWLGHIMATTYNENSYQLREVADFIEWCSEQGIKATHLFGRQEWRW